MIAEQMKIGIYCLNMTGLGGGDKQALALAEHLCKEHDVYLFTQEAIDVDYCEAYFDLDLSRLKIVVLKEPEESFKIFPGIRRLYYHRMHMVHFKQIRKFKLDVFFNYSYGSQLIAPANHGIYMCMFPTSPTIVPSKAQSRTRATNAVLRKVSASILKRELYSFESYRVITSVSKYTSNWISILWERESFPVYAVCDPIGATAPKRKWLLNVGRFTGHDPLAHHKRQDVLISEFIKMEKLHREGWELHLAGTVNARDIAAVEYVNGLKHASEGFPIYFHCNASRNELVELYKYSAIYLHSTGYGSQPSDSPHSQEHFGITTVEAMSAGCVPIVINSGGQPEIVTDGVDGLLWNNLDELHASVAKITSDEKLMVQLSCSAEEAGNRYTRARFNVHIDKLLASIPDK